VTKTVDPDLIAIEIDALKVTQQIGDLFVASIEYDVLCKISFFDVRRVLRDQRDFERYLGIQRPLNEKRVEALEKYVNYLDATFPSSIILAIDDEYATYDERRRKLVLRNNKEGESSPSIAISEIARVLDGQHRIAGLENFHGSEFGLPVTIFVGSDIADQAYIFSTVNLEQTKVSKSLVCDLFELAESRSPQKTCHNIAVALDRDEKSPFFQRIKRLGFATPDKERKLQTLTQATFVESLMSMLSSDPKQDRDSLLRGQKLGKASEPESRRLIFRNLFIEGKDTIIAKIVHNYFDAVREKWEAGWDSTDQGMMLNKTNGFRALMRLLPRSYLRFSKQSEMVSKDKFFMLFDRVSADDSYSTVDEFKPGTSGEKDLADFLSKYMFS